MKGKTILIVVGILFVLLIAFFIWRSNKQRQLALQAQQQQQMYNQMNQNGSGQSGNQNQGGLAGTMDSVGGIIESLTGLFGAVQGSGVFNGSGNSGGSNDSNYMQIANSCESIYNTDQAVQDCINEQLMS